MTDLASRPYGFYSIAPKRAVAEGPSIDNYGDITWYEPEPPVSADFPTAEAGPNKRCRSLEPDDPRHGTDNGYNNHGCRCDDCRSAWRLRMRQQREARRNRPVPEDRHGTVSGYNNWFCRCDRCRAAYRATYKPSPRRAENRAKTEAMHADYCDGMSVEQVAQEWSTTPGAVYSRFHSAGLKRRTSGRPAAMYVDYCTGLSIQDVAAKWGVSDKAVWAAFRRLKVPLRPQHGCANRTVAPKGVPFKEQNAARAVEAGRRKAEAAKAALDRVVDERQRQVLELRATHPDKSLAELARRCVARP